MKYYCLVLFLVLLVRASIQSTIYVDNVDYNYVTTEVPAYVASTTTATIADAGRFTLTPSSDLAIDTTGQVHLEGSFVRIDSDTSLIQKADGNITLDSTDTLALANTHLNITAGDDFSMTTLAKNLEVNVGGSVEAYVDQAFIAGEGSVTINSGGGNIEIISDHVVQYAGANTNILGENRVTFETIYDISVNAENTFESRSNLIDFNTLGDIRITSTTSNVKFIAGSELQLEGEKISFSAVEGVDVSSLHGDIYVDSAQSLFITSLDTVDFEIIDDANFISRNGAISIKAPEFSANAHDLIFFDSSNIETTSSNFKIETLATSLETQGSIQFTFTGNTLQDTLFSAQQEILISTNTFNSTSDSLSISTTGSDPETAGSIEFQSNASDEGFFSIASDGDTTFSSLSEIAMLSGSIENTADNFFLQSFLDINIVAEFKTFDFVNVQGPEIDLTGNKEVINGNVALLESQNAITFTHGSLSITAHTNDGTASFSSGNQVFLFTDTGDIQSKGDSQWVGYSIAATSEESFTSNVYEKTSFFSNDTSFDSNAEINVQSSFINLVSDDIQIFSVGDDLSYYAEHFDFWANENGAFQGVNSMEFSFTDTLTIRSFLDLEIQNLLSLSATSSLGFEANENIDILAYQNFLAQANSVLLETHARSSLQWTGSQFNVISDGTNFEAPASSFSALDDLSLTASSVQVRTVNERPIHVFANGDASFSMGDGSSFVNSDRDVSFQSTDFFSVALENITFTAGDSIVYRQYGNFIATVSGSENVISDGSVSFSSEGSIEFNSTDAEWTVNRDSTINAGGSTLLTTIDTEFNIDEFYITSTAPNYYEDGDVSFTTGGDMTVSLSGSFSQQGGSVSYTIEGNDFQTAADTYSINSYDRSDITTDGDIDFYADYPDSSIRFQSMSSQVFAISHIDFLGGDITIASNRSQDIYFQSEHNITFNTQNRGAFTWLSRDDINSTMGNFTVRANVQDENGNSISFSSTHEEGNIIVNVRSGWLNLQSRDTQTYIGDFIELFAANDLTFNTSLALSPNTGGITFTTDGFLHNAVAGDKSGISFSTTGILDSIYLTAPVGQQSFFAGYDLTVNSNEGTINFLANEAMSFTSSQANILISSSDLLSFVTDTGNITFQTSASSTEFRASQNIDLSAGTNIFLTSTDPITKTNGRAFEFAAASGHINVLANSDSDINWIAGGDIYTQSAESSTQFASEGIFYTAINGRYLADGKAGVKLLVQNGDLNLNASQNIAFSSGNNWDIFVSSGQSQFWTALTKNIQYGAGENTTIRTERNNITFLTDQGNVFMQSTGQIRMQADGTDSNPSGSNVDGVMVIAPNIDVFAVDKSIIESNAHVTIGAVTTPVVKFEAGGSAGAVGFNMTSLGNILFTIQEDVNINSGDRLYMEAAKEFNLESTGSISISTTGSDASGKDVVFRTFSQMDVDAQAASFTGHENVHIGSEELVSFISKGNNPVSNFVEFSSALDFALSVEFRMDVNSANWETVATQQFDIVVTGDLFFTNYLTNSTGQIYIYGDQALDFVADSYLDVTSTGASGNITLKTIGTISDIFIEAEQTDSSIRFFASDNLVSTTANDLNFQTITALTFSAQDNVDDDVENGNIIISTPDDWQADSNTLTLQGDEGVSFVTVNKADINLQSQGEFVVQSYEKMIFNSENGKLSVSANEYMDFSTYPGQDGDIIISTTRDLLVNGESATFVYGDEMIIGGQTISFDSALGLSFISEGPENDVIFKSDVIDLTAGSVLQIFGGETNFLSTGTAYMHADEQIEIVTVANHGHISYEALQLLQVTGPFALNLRAIAFSGTTYPEIHPNNGKGFVSFTAEGTNPEFGYGILLNATESIDLSSSGSVIFYSPTAAVNMTTESGISFTTSTTQKNANAIQISASGTDSKTTIRANSTFSVNSDNRATFYADKSIQFFPYETLSVVAGGGGPGDTEQAIEIISTHPNAGIQVITTDFLTGSVLFNAAQNDIYAERGINFHLQDDDDAESIGTYQVTAQYISIQSENSGIVESIAGGDLVVREASALHVHAGDDIYLSAREQLLIAATGTFTIDTLSPVSFSSSVSISQTSGGNTVYDVDGDVFLFSADSTTLSSSSSITLSAGTNDEGTRSSTISFNSDQLMTLSGNVATISTSKGRSIDFVDGLVIPTVNGADNLFTYSACTIDRQFVYETSNNQFCYCDGTLYLCAQTMVALVPY